jgi:hypothetical protein
MMEMVILGVLLFHAESAGLYINTSQKFKNVVRCRKIPDVGYYHGYSSPLFINDRLTDV